MDADNRARLESDIRRHHQAADFRSAADLAVRGFGPEIYGFLRTLEKNEQDAFDVFSAFTERVVRGLPKFKWESSFRTWAYTIARNASRNFREHAKVRKRAHAPLPDDPDLWNVAERVRSETASYLKTRSKTLVERLRESLSPQEQLLLSLRVDRKLGFKDIARVLSDPERPPSAADLERDAAKLRQRFKVVKERLATMVRRERERRPS